MNKKNLQMIFNFIAKKYNDPISSSGFISSFTGKPFSKEEVEEFSQNVYLKLKIYLDIQNTKVLEIGCANGITMYRIAPFVKKYIGTDIAKVNLEKNAKYNAEHNITNIELHNLAADEIDKIKCRNINVVILNSVVQYFDSEEYLMEVIEKAAKIMNYNGILYIGDIRDRDKISLYKEELVNYRRLHNLPLKNNVSDTELCIKKGFFKELKKNYPYIKSFEISDKIGKIENELTKYRYDCLMKI